MAMLIISRWVLSSAMLPPYDNIKYRVIILPSRRSTPLCSIAGEMHPGEKEQLEYNGPMPLLDHNEAATAGGNEI